jgi:hypothetical protein
LVFQTLTPSFPNELVIKLISTVPATGTTSSPAGTCNPALTGGFATALAPGMLAWGTTTHIGPGGSLVTTETPFSPGKLVVAEIDRDIEECQFIQILGSGNFGICKGCSNVGLGAAAE